jgi:hypothetical protein
VATPPATNFADTTSTSQVAGIPSAAAGAPAAATPTDRYTPLVSATDASMTAADAGRYDRYSTPPTSDTTLSLNTTAGTTPSGTMPAASGGTESFDPYSRYSAAATSVAATTTTTDSATSTVASQSSGANQAVASVEIPASAGGYRPGGTSNYPTTQASAVSIATRPAGSESPTTPAGSTPSGYRGYR